MATEFTEFTRLPTEFTTEFTRNSQILSGIRKKGRWHTLDAFLLALGRLQGLSWRTLSSAWDPLRYPWSARGCFLGPCRAFPTTISYLLVPVGTSGLHLGSLIGAPLGNVSGERVAAQTLASYVCKPCVRYPTEAKIGQACWEGSILKTPQGGTGMLGCDGPMVPWRPLR